MNKLSYRCSDKLMMRCGELWLWVKKFFQSMGLGLMLIQVSIYGSTLSGIVNSQTIDYVREVPKIIGYRVVESDELGCWSKLDVFWDNGTTNEEKELIERKIIQYELYREDGIEPIIRVTRIDKTLQTYHIVKLPSDTFWRD